MTNKWQWVLRSDIEPPDLMKGDVMVLTIVKETKPSMTNGHKLC